MGKVRKSPPPADGNNAEDSPITGLKSTILSIDTKISDEVLTSLIEEIGGLENIYKDDKDLLLFLHLLRSVGKYINKRKGHVHLGAIRLLNSVYNSLELVLLSKDISEEEKKQTLLAQVQAFKKLQDQIARGKTDAAEKDEAKPLEMTKSVLAAEKEKDETVQVEKRPPDETIDKLSSDISSLTPQKALAYILDEVKQVIRAEFKELKEELKKYYGS
ncbi:hypothetical protein ACFL0M_06000 [Thermodesulfobacteriota bacterium]